MSNKYFGTDGIRGTVNQGNITGEKFFKFGLASATYFKNQKKTKQIAIIAKDTRLSGYTLEPALVSGLVSGGMHVFTLGPLPTNGLAMLTKSMKANMGIMITASHNPYYDNGLKLFGPNGMKLSNQIENIIIRFKKKFPKIPLSLDTRKSYVMKKGIECGVSIINDVSGLNFDKKSFDTINSNKIPFILHHMQGSPKTMQDNPTYEDVLLDIFDFFEEKINFCLKHNYKKELIILDPGIGFGKNLDHNLRLMSKISIFHSLGCPILIGTSRKRFIEHIVTKFDTPDRTGGSLASVLYGLLQGVQLFRVHNVKEINQGILVFNKILNTN